MDEWDLSSLFHPLSKTAPIAGDQIIVVASDMENDLAVGFDAAENLILIGPQFDEFDKVVHSKFLLEPNKSFELAGKRIDRAYKFTFKTPDDFDLLIAVGMIGGIRELNRQLNCKVPSRALIRLSRSLANVNISETEIGLFGELVILLNNMGNERVTNSWHRALQDPFDFAYRNSRLEVKTTCSPQRKHWFSESQISSQVQLDLWVASVRLAPTHAGTSCGALRDMIESALEPKFLQDFRAKCEGYNWDEFSLEFDLDAAISSVSYFNAAQLPKPRRESLEITSIKWQLDLSLLTPVAPEEIALLSPSR
jgi:hypothetical protein